MRHFGSIILSIVFAPIIYVLAGIGMIRLATNSGLVAQGRGTNWTDVGIGAGAVVVAGALYAILAMARISPLGPLIAGLAYVAAQLWALFRQANVVSTLGRSVFGTSGAAEAPLTGLALLLAVPLLATIFSSRRWRGKESAVAPTYPEIPSATPAYPQPTSAAPDYADNSESFSPAEPSTLASTTPEPTSLEPTAPGQTTPDTAGDTRTDEATAVEHRSDSTNP